MQVSTLVDSDSAVRGLHFDSIYNERSETAMKTTLHGITTEALKLPNNEREALIDTLVASVVPPSPLHPEWEAEIARRLVDIETGHVTLIPSEQVFAEVRALIGGHQRRMLEAGSAAD